MTRNHATAVSLVWSEPSPAVDNAIGNLLDEAVAGVGHVLHGDALTGRGRHVVVSTSGIDVVRVVSMIGAVRVATAADGAEALYLGGRDVSDVLSWLDDVVGAVNETFDSVGTRAPVRGWLCVLDADWSSRTEPMVVRGYRVVRYGALAHELGRRTPSRPSGT
jgi:hypothetical protein